MSFVLCVLYAEANAILACFEISDWSTNPNRGRDAKIKREISEKAHGKSHDNSNPTGCTTDQMLSS